MKHTCEWHDETKTILVIRALMHWEWEDIDSALADQMTHVRSVPHDVYTIYDLKASPVIPKGIALPKLKRLTSTRLPNQRLTIYVGMGFLQRRLMDVTRAAFYLTDLFKNFHFVDTLEEALHIIDVHKKKLEHV